MGGRVSKSKRRRTRRKRRQERTAQRSRGKFKVGHKSKSGRTGAVAEKQRSGAAHEAQRRVPRLEVAVADAPAVSRPPGRTFFLPSAPPCPCPGCTPRESR
jgi:hypothetical protein